MLTLSPMSASAEKLPKSVVADLDATFENAYLDTRSPGMIYGVVKDNKMAHMKAFGVRDLENNAPVTKDTAFRIASMTKMMTSLLIHDLADQGKLALDDPAEKYVPVLKTWKYPTTDSRKVTVRDFVNHTAGFVTDDPWADRQLGVSQETLDEYLENAAPFSHAPGTHWEYSNLGYTLLGQIIEKVTGQTYADYMQTRLLDPLNLKDTHLDGNKIPENQKAKAYNWIVEDNKYIDEPYLASGTFDPLGGIWTTASDYQKFISWFLSAWPARDGADNGPIPRRVVRSVTDTQRLMGTRSRLGITGQSDCEMAVAYAMGLGVYDHCDAGMLLTHGGGFPGYGSYVIMSPHEGWGVFGFGNETYGKARYPTWEAMAIIASSGAYTVSEYPLAADPQLLKSYDQVKAIYAAEDINGSDTQFANNFFMDRSEDRWNRQLKEIKAEVGECTKDNGISHDGRLTGSFSWHCERGRVKGRITLMPVKPLPIQKLHLRAVVRDGRGSDVNMDSDFH
ncbi:MAG: serine hydrolase domain-containing protein [Pseudomonadota bacterium]